MNRLLGTGICMMALAVGTTSAHALPAPMSEEELDKASDVVATVRVLAVVRIDDMPFDKTRETVRTYQAWLQLVQPKKGNIKAGETLLVQWHDTPKNLIGPWKVEYHPGEEVLTHLKWNATQRSYVSTWWNAKGKPVHAADSAQLPERVGEVIAAKELGKQSQGDKVTK